MYVKHSVKKNSYFAAKASPDSVESSDAKNVSIALVLVCLIASFTVLKVNNEVLCHPFLLILTVLNIN